MCTALHILMLLFDHFSLNPTLGKCLGCDNFYCKAISTVHSVTTISGVATPGPARARATIISSQG